MIHTMAMASSSTPGDHSMGESTLRCSLGKLRLERHHTAQQVRQAKARLHQLQAQQQQNARQIRAIEQRLRHCSEGQCPATPKPLWIRLLSWRWPRQGEA